MYAVIQTGGKQYKVNNDQVLKVEKLAGNPGDTVMLDQVLARGDDKNITLGEPVIKDAKVSAEILEQKKDKKVIVFKKKRRHNYRRKNGHRQEVTVLRIIDVEGKAKKAAAPKKAAVKKDAPKTEPKAEAKKETATKE